MQVTDTIHILHSRSASSALPLTVLHSHLQGKAPRRTESAASRQNQSQRLQSARIRGIAAHDKDDL